MPTPLPPPPAHPRKPVMIALTVAALMLVLGGVLARLLTVLIDDFWLIAIAWLQP